MVTPYAMGHAEDPLGPGAMLSWIHHAGMHYIVMYGAVECTDRAQSSFLLPEGSKTCSFEACEARHRVPRLVTVGSGRVLLRPAVPIALVERDLSRRLIIS